MLYPSNKENELNLELFDHPTSEYRGAPFWAWNTRVTKKLIDDQIAVFEQMGFGGVHIHARTGLQTPYLGEEFLSLVHYADEQLKKRGMLCWLYDEDRFPSGSAGGMVTEDFHLRARYLLFTRERKSKMEPSKEAFEQALREGRQPRGYYVTSYRIQVQHGRLLGYEREDGPLPEMDMAREQQKGKLFLVYMELMKPSPWYNDNTYIDVMNPQAAERFLAITHEAYAGILGEEFGKSVPAIFTDEPQIRGSMTIPNNDSEGDVTLSFTDDFADTYQEVFGENIMDFLPEILWGGPSVHRLRYHEHLSERFVSAYCDQIASWCEAHHLAMTGHFMSEPLLYSQTLRLGETMRCYRSEQIPGVDILCGDPEYTTIKQAESVRRQYGREALLCETLGVNNWDFDFKGHKLQGDWQAALGVTVRVPHLAWMSMEGEAKRDWPASISFQSPWWKDYDYIENYFARLNVVLTRGEAICHIGVIHPIESYWIYYGPENESGGVRNEMDEQFVDLTKILLFGLLDFDFLSESMMPDENAHVESREGEPFLVVGKCAYRTIVVPNLYTIRHSTLELLKEFHRAGGKVIFAGHIPQYLDGISSKEASSFAKDCTRIPFMKTELLHALESEREIEVRRADGRRSEDLFAQYRQDGAKRWLFLCHTQEVRTNESRMESDTIQIRGTFKVRRFDALSGEIFPEEAKIERTADAGLSTCHRLRRRPGDPIQAKLPAQISPAGAAKYAALGYRYESGNTILETTMYAEDSLLLELTPVRVNTAEVPTEAALADRTIPRGTLLDSYGLTAGVTVIPHLKRTLETTILHPTKVLLEDANVFLIDRAAWSLNQGKIHEEDDILRLDNKVRDLLCLPHRQDAVKQPWRIEDGPDKNRVTLWANIHSDVETVANPAMEYPEKCSISWNGEQISSDSKDWYVDPSIRILSGVRVRRGDNVLEINLPYGEKSGLEAVYLLGDFGVEIRGTRKCIVSLPTQLYFGDLTRQRLPFYGGNVTYEMPFTISENSDLFTKVPHYAAPVLEVTLDGDRKGLIAFAPNELHLGCVREGTHILRITACGSRVNTFGELHNCNPEYKWYGPDSFRTEGDNWSEEYCLRETGILSRVEIWRKE